MKKLNKDTRHLFYALLCIVIFYGCESNATTSVESTTKGGMITQGNGVFQTQYELEEFEYKGHTYISCHVRDGIALTHAGHCKCNNKNN